MKFSPDYIGFIFYQKSPRFVGSDFKMPDVPSGIKKVGVFVDESVERIESMVAKFSLDLVQLHGNESVETCAKVKNSTLGVIKAFSVDERFDFKITEPYQSAVDYFLFDTKGVNYGGNGKRFDWGILNQYNQEIPFFLSGGISLQNIQEVSILKNLNIHAVDVNSGIETSPGIKDISKVVDIKAILTSNSSTPNY
jgi:phosphoribosylanthranilate isomerase